MTIQNDISANTIIIGVSVALGTYVLRSLGKLLLQGLAKAAEHSIKLYGKMVLVESKLDEFLLRTADHEKLRGDVNKFYDRARSMEARITDLETPH